MRRPRPVASEAADIVVEQVKVEERKPQTAKSKPHAKKTQTVKYEIQEENNEVKSE